MTNTITQPSTPPRLVPIAGPARPPQAGQVRLSDIFAAKKHGLPARTVLKPLAILPGLM